MVLCGNLLEFEQYTGNVLEHAGRLPDVLGLVHAGEPVGELLRARMVAKGRMQFLLVRTHRQQQALGLLSWRPRLGDLRSEEHTSELQSLMRISYAVFCLKKKKRAQS